VLSAEKAIYIPVNHLDGAFQTASGLFRIAGGQIPGVDFFPYLGIGPLLLLFPGFLISGGDLSSSVFTSHFMTLLILQATIGITYFLLKKNVSYKELIIGTISLFYIYIFLVPQLPIDSGFSSFIGINALSELSQPGNSLRPVRAFSIWLTVLIIFLLSSRIARKRKTNVVIGFFLALIGTLWSNDYALAAMVMGFAVTSFSLSKSKTICKSCIFEILSAFAIAFLLIFLIFNENGWRNSFFAYNYLDVRLDQFWYFGPWGNQFRILDFSDFIEYFWEGKLLFPIAVLLILLLRVISLRQLEDFSLLMIGSGLFLGGSLATIGGHIYIYFHPFKLWGFLVACNFLLLRIQGKIKSKTRSKRISTINKKILTWCLFVTLVTIMFQETNTFLKEQNLANKDNQFIFNNKLGGFVDKDFVPRDIEFRTDKEGLLEEYFGLEQALFGFNGVNKVDSVIHALGQQRLEFQKSILLKPSRVITSSPEIGDWFAWNISANWWFYRTLFMNYSAEINSPLTLKWIRQSHTEWPIVDCSVSDMGRSIEIRETSSDFYEVMISYIGSSSGQREFSMIQNNLNIGQSTDAYLALDPGQKKQSFPVIGIPGGTKLHLTDVSKSSRVVTRITSCVAKKIIISDSGNTREILDSLIEPSTAPANFSDQNWNSGVSKVFAGFFVRDRPANHYLFKIGKKIEFANGDVRTIDNVIFTGGYINVFLGGKILDPKLYGYPKKFTVLEK
jgi:hypothetical protein